jgi:hypothetical protein
MGQLAALALTAALLGACSSMRDFGTSTSSPSTEPTQPAMMSAAEIRSVLSGRSWHFQGPNNSGTTLYAADGTSLVEVNGKGTTKGTWTTKDGQLCEAFAPAAFLPNGVPMTCYPFSGSGNTYQAGKAVFTLAG